MKLIIFDLDDTLFPSSELATKSRKNACQAIVDKGLNDTKENVYEKLMIIVKKFGSNSRDHFNELIMQYNVDFPGKYIATAVKAYHETKAKELKIFDGVYEILKDLKEKGYILILMTNGPLVKQWDKIERLKLDETFKDYFVSDNQNQSITKDIIFGHILSKYNVEAKDALVIGDRLDTDIISANKLNIKNIRILQGKYANLMPKCKEEEPSYTVNHISEIVKLPILQ